MYLLPPLVLLAWLPWLVLGNIAVAVEMSGAVATPGQRITYVISANPIPQGTLGIILTEVAVSGDAGARRSWSWSLILTTAPQEVALTIPNGVPSQFYTIDLRTNTSVDSPLLASSNSFEIVSNTPPTTQIPTHVAQSTRVTTIVTTHETVVQSPPKSINLQSGPASQDTIFTHISVATQNHPWNSNASSGSTSSTSSSTSSSQTTSQSAAVVASRLVPTPSSIPSANSPAATDPTKKFSAIGPAVGGGSGIIITILVFFFLWWRYYNKRHDRVVISDMAEGNHPDHHRDTATITAISTSPFSNIIRGLRLNHTNTAVSAFVSGSERSASLSSAGQTMNSKSHGGYSGSAGGSVRTQDATASGNGGTSDQLSSERERVTREISALRMRDVLGDSTLGHRSGSVGWSSGPDTADEEMRTRMDVLTQHIARLENALENAANVYVAPPTYQRPLSRVSIQRG